MGEAIETVQQLYPGLLENNHNLLFMLKVSIQNILAFILIFFIVIVFAFMLSFSDIIILSTQHMLPFSGASVY